MNQLRILMLSSFYPPDIGGAQRQIQLLSRELVRRGHVVAVVTVWQTGLPEQEDDQGVAVHRLKGLTTRVPWFSQETNRRHHPPFPDPAIVHGLRRLIDQLQPDVVHSYAWITYSGAAALFGKNIPLIISARTYAYTCPTTSMLRHGELCDGPAPMKCLECAAHRYGSISKSLVAVAGVRGGKAFLKRKVTGVHSVSTYVQETIRRDLFDGEATLDAVIPSFRENTAQKPADPEFLNKLPDRPYILFVGALTPHKGLPILLEAYKKLTNAPPLILIGTVRGDTPSTFPPEVTVFNDVPHDDVMAAWERCLFGVSPSLWPEPFASVVHECMSKGKAMIGTSAGGYTDIIVEGENGLLVPIGDVSALAQAMQRLIDDPALCDRLGKAAQERASMYTAEYMVPRFEALYRQATGLSCGSENEVLGSTPHI